MKASILALTISTALSVNAFAASTEVDIQAADAATNELIDQQMRDIDASVQTQLDLKYADAQANEIAVVDDVVYEQDSNGTWAAVGTASAALVAGLLSSSSSSSDSHESDPIPSLPIQSMPDNELPGDDSGIDTDIPDNSQVVFTVYNGMIAIDDKLVGHINDAGYITDANGNTVGQVQKEDSTVSIVLDNGDVLKVIEAGNGWVIDLDDSTVDGGMDQPDAPHTVGDISYDEGAGTALIHTDNGIFVSISEDGTYTMLKDGVQSTGNVHDLGDVTKVGNGYQIATENGTYVVSSFDGRLSIVLIDGGNPELQSSRKTKLQNIDQNKLKQMKAKVQSRLATLKK